MIKQDILKCILAGTLSEEGADDLLDAIMDSNDSPLVEKLLGLSHIEWVAHIYGASWTDMAGWRQDGWPSACAVCRRPIDVNQFGWRIIEVGGSSRLKHFACSID